MASSTDTNRGLPPEEVRAPGSKEAQAAAAERGNPLKASLPEGADTTGINKAVNLATTEFSETYRNLSPERQAMMHLGFTQPNDDFETAEPLGEKCLVAITTSGKTGKVLTDRIIASGLALPLGTPIVAGPDSSSETRIFLLPKVANAYDVARLSQQENLPAKLVISKQTDRVFRMGTQVIPLDATILANTIQSDISSTTLEIGHWDKAQATQITDFPPNTPRIFGEPSSRSRYAQNIKLQTAQRKEGLPRRLVEKSTYIILDINKLLKDPQVNSPKIQSILAKLASLAVSPDFFATLDQKGNLIIVDRSQRSGSHLAIMTTEIKEATGGETNIFIGHGNFKRKDGTTGLENYPDATSLAVWERRSAKKAETYLTKQTRDAISGRGTTTVDLEFEIVEDEEDLLILKSVKRAARLRIGGPEKFIGNESELERTKKTLNPASVTKLAIVNGGAGSGKSRLADEVLKDHPNALVHSVDASGENIPGASLADLAVTISNALDTRLDEAKKIRFATEIENLNQFAKQPEEKRISDATNISFCPILIKDCLRALQILEKCNGSFVLTIDDMHHIDRHSEPYITNLIEKFLTQSKSKALIIRRPEETYQSIAQNNLAANVRRLCRKEDDDSNPVEDINLHKEDGQPKLDIRDEKIAHDYVYYSLPEDLRKNKATGQDRNLGNWPQELAAKCRTPFDFTSLINSLLEHPEESFIEGVDTLSLTESAKTAVSTIEDGDLLGYHQNRMRRLSDSSREILQCVAILGSKISRKQLNAIASKIVQIDENAVDTNIEELQKGGYVIINPDGSFTIQHDNYKDIAISTLDEREKRSLIKKIYDQFQGSGNIHNDRKFALLCEISDRIPIITETENFWMKYIGHADQAMADASRERAYGRGYSIAMTILGNLDDKNRSALYQELTALENPQTARTVPPEIRAMLIKALFAVVQNGLHLGRFEKTAEAINTLRQVNADEALLTQAYVIGFRAAYTQNRVAAMKTYSQRADETQALNAEDHLDMEIRLNFKLHKFDACANAFKDPHNLELLETLKTTNTASYNEFMRLKQRISFERLRINLEKDGVDGDVTLEPGFLNDKDLAAIKGIRRQLEQLNATHKQDPESFDPLQELHLLDQLGEIQGLLGHYKQAGEVLSEVWRLAQQMGIPLEAARAAKSKGDIHMMEGLTQSKNTADGRSKVSAIPNGTIIRNHVVKAIQTYTENGLKPIEKIATPYQVILRGQRLRAISILVNDYKKEIAAGDTEEVKAALIPHLKTAIEDFEYINASSYGASNDPSYVGEVSYYSTTSMGPILSNIEALGLNEEDLGIEIPDILDDTKYTAFQSATFFYGLQCAAKKKDNVGEVDMRKIPGYGELIDLGKRRAEKAKDSRKLGIFTQLSQYYQGIVQQRAA